MNTPTIFRTFAIDACDGWWLEVADDNEGTDGYTIMYKEKHTIPPTRIFIPKEYIQPLIDCLNKIKEPK